MPKRYFAVRDVNRFIRKQLKSFPRDFFTRLYSDRLRREGDPIECYLDVTYSLFCEGPCRSDTDDSYGYFDPAKFEELRKEFPHARSLLAAIALLEQYVVEGERLFPTSEEALNSVK